MPGMRAAYIMLPVFFIAACSAGEGDRSEEAVPLIKNALTLDLIIEDSDSSGEPVLIEPDDIDVDADGNILITDEKIIKVFDREGRFLEQIGREGQGPGEFVAAFSITVGPAGYLTAKDVLWEFNIYAPDYSFLSKSRYRNEPRMRNYIAEEGFTFTMLGDVISFDAENRLLDLFALNMTGDEKYPSWEQLIYIRPDTLIELCQYHPRNSVRTGPSSNNSLEYQGAFLWSLLDEDRLVYTESGIDYVLDEEDPEYYLMVVSLSTTERDTLAIPLEPLKIPDACKNEESRFFEVLGERIEMDPVITQIHRQTEYYPPLKALRADNSLIFGFTHSTLDSIWHDFEYEGKLIPNTVDVIDVEAEGLIARAEFPLIPDTIRNGFAYLIYSPPDDYPSIRRYRIDPLLYSSDGHLE